MQEKTLPVIATVLQFSPQEAEVMKNAWEKQKSKFSISTVFIFDLIKKNIKKIYCLFFFIDIEFWEEFEEIEMKIEITLFYIYFLGFYFINHDYSTRYFKSILNFS